MERQKEIQNETSRSLLDPIYAQMMLLQRIRAEATAIAEERAKAEASKLPLRKQRYGSQDGGKSQLEKERFKISEALKIDGFPGRTQNCEEEKATEEGR
jgi:hypothetical protein